MVTRGTVLTKFWQFHYFDWLLFAKRGATIAWAGGLLAGIVLFGSPDLTLKRAINRYQWLCGGIAVDWNNKEGKMEIEKF